MNAATLSGPYNDRSMTPAMRASRLLGWVSFGIAAAEILAPRRVARAVGMNESSAPLLRAYGAREAIAGVGAHSVYPVPALWSRVAGDLLDIGTIAVGSRQQDGSRNRNAWIAMAAVAGITVIDAIVAAKLADETKEGKGEVRDYSDRSGFPGGVESARGAGVVKDAFDGKAGGAAAGDASPAGEASSGRTQTDLTGAPAETQSAFRPGLGDGQGGVTGSRKGMSGEVEKAIPEPPAYTPA